MSRLVPVALTLSCFALMGMGGCPTTGLPGSEPTTGSQALFDEVWTTFDENYSYFTYKGIDWDDAWTRYRPNFASDLSADQFVDQLIPMLAELQDWHVDVMRADGTWVATTTETYEENYPHTPRKLYTLGNADYQVLGNNIIYHAWFNDNIAYIRVDTLATDTFASANDADIQALFDTMYASAAAMIIDIRPNNGGNEQNAAKFASHFTSGPVVYGYTETRNGPDHDDFDPLQDKVLEAVGPYFSGPVACLIGQRCMSSAEWFALMMRACPNVTLIGDTTRGASGSPEEFSLSNGVGYKLSRWIAYTPDLVEIEDQGVEPDIAIAPGDASFDAGHDYVIERAIAELTP
jgi:hypothetical protein